MKFQESKKNIVFIGSEDFFWAIIPENILNFMFTMTGQLKNKCNLLSSMLTVHNSLIVHNTFMRKLTSKIVLVIFSNEFIDLEIGLQLRPGIVVELESFKKKLEPKISLVSK